MGIYIFNLLSMPVYGLIKNKKVSTFLASLQMFLILALRSNTTGVDLINYIGGYQFIGSMHFGELLSRLHLIKIADLVYPYAYESGYTVLNWIASKLGLSFHGFLVLLAAFTMLSVGVFIYRYSVRPWLSFVLFIGLGMYTYSFGILRQTIALSILLWSIPYVEKKKYKPLIAIFALAFTIHRSSIIFALLVFFANFKIKKEQILKYLFLCIGLTFLSPYLYRFLIVKILSILRKERYFSTAFSLNNQIILMFTIAILVVLLIDFKAFQNPTNRLVFWGFLLSIPFEILGMNNDGFARIIEYYYIFAIILIPFAVESYGICFDSDGRIMHKRGIERTPILFLAKIVIIIAMLWLMIHRLEGTLLVPYVLY